ncbi:hypothetical protein PGIGA_G00208160 [Pangasianodon gigas]|uniref:Uncharacterized protein n=1 Tax=Pangasianodon gigas TaxID=30993 RepID=A0ACC5WFQ5_PANGG|nr:hypothetical protein [Pangasianodon gigas]
MPLGATWTRVKNVCQQNGLLILSVLAVVVGCLLGFFLRSKHLSEQEVKYFQFPGELLMRMLKMLILPLVVSRYERIDFFFPPEGYAACLEDCLLE